MTMLLGLMLIMQTPSGKTAEPIQRLGERLHYLDPYQSYAYSCDHRIARKQGRLFEKRFGKRIADLKLKEIALRGPDLGFDAIAIGHCNTEKVGLDRKFRAELDKFDAELSAIEGEFP
jgi:hypothetical protein